LIVGLTAAAIMSLVRGGVNLIFDPFMVGVIQGKVILTFAYGLP